MIVQLINNISWATLLVIESKTWRSETFSMVKEQDTKCQFSNAKIKSKEVSEIKVTGVNDV